MKYLLSSILAMAVSTFSFSQESMMGDVSYGYLDKLIVAARENYPKFKATQARVNAAKAAVSRAKLGYLDFFTFTYIYNPRNTVTIYDANANAYNNYNNNNILRGYQLGVYVNIGNAVQKPTIVRQAREEYNMAMYDKATVDLNLEAEVKQRYFTYLQQSNIVKLKARTLVDADDVLKNTKYKFEKGQVPFEDYNKVLINHSIYAQEKITAEAQMLIAKSALEEIIGTKLENVK